MGFTIYEIDCVTYFMIVSADGCDMLALGEGDVLTSYFQDNCLPLYHIIHNLLLTHTNAHSDHYIENKGMVIVLGLRR